MTLEAGKEMDRKCVFDWLNKVFIAPSLAYSQYTDDEIRIFAHDALVLLKEQPEIVRCKDRKHYDEDKKETVGIERTNKDGISTIRYVQLVRCKDCEWWGTDRMCENSDSPCFQNGCTHGNWFCADGERK